MTVEQPPDHVLAAFGLTGVRPVPLGSSWEGGWRCGEVVLSMVADHPRAAWSAKVRETLFVDGVRLARPVRSTDGRFVVAGWRADTYVAGTPEPRHDEVVSSAVRLHEATAKLERPRFLTQPPVAPWADVDVFIAADRAAWEERPLHSMPPGARVSPQAPGQAWSWARSDASRSRTTGSFTSRAKSTGCRPCLFPSSHRTSCWSRSRRYFCACSRQYILRDKHREKCQSKSSAPSPSASSTSSTRPTPHPRTLTTDYLGYDSYLWGAWPTSVCELPGSRDREP